ncbi:TIGR01244 family sulfur transferase [Altererythrobacter aquiaggeris]|uniref:TIGR01244 family sulfur transferase n=1 Tax=Aestuarierythrobacter aquiaggeris TaxID=1898396 RepID=UPI00301B0F76
MDITRLSPHYAVSAQLTRDDLEHAARLGFRTIVDNRPDGEAPDQPSAQAMEIAAQKLGLGFAYIPVVPGEPCTQQAVMLKQVLATMETPVLAYCRSGARSTLLWQEYCKMPPAHREPDAR